MTGRHDHTGLERVPYTSLVLLETLGGTPHYCESCGKFYGPGWMARVVRAAYHRDFLFPLRDDRPDTCIGRMLDRNPGELPLLRAYTILTEDVGTLARYLREKCFGKAGPLES